eukprot:3853573-Ditylum_brightwellii.AAC.1
MQAYHQGFLIQYFYDDEFIPFEEWISKRRDAAAIKLQSTARLFLQQSRSKAMASTVQNKLLIMLEKMQKELSQDMEETK